MIPAAADPADLTLRVQLTPRGTSQRVIEINDLPTQPCAFAAYAHVGDRIAIGFDATDFTPPVDVNVIAWLDGRPMDYVGVETTTVAAIYRRLDLDLPDTSTVESESPAGTSWVGLLAAGLLAGAVAFIRFGRGLDRAPSMMSRSIASRLLSRPGSRARRARPSRAGPRPARRRARPAPGQHVAPRPFAWRPISRLSLTSRTMNTSTIGSSRPCRFWLAMISGTGRARAGARSSAPTASTNV